MAHGRPVRFWNKYSPDTTTTTVAGCIGVALGLLDDWLTGAIHFASRT
jgi:hypothetical protein